MLYPQIYLKTELKKSSARTDHPPLAAETKVYFQKKKKLQSSKKILVSAAIRRKTKTHEKRVKRGQPNFEERTNYRIEKRGSIKRCEKVHINYYCR